MDLAGANGAADAVFSTPKLLRSPPETTKGAHRALLRRWTLTEQLKQFSQALLCSVLLLTRATDAILKSPAVLRARADTIMGTHEADVGILGVDRATDAILKSPARLKAPADMIMGTHEADVGILGAHGAAAGNRKGSGALCSPADTMSASKELAAPEQGRYAASGGQQPSVTETAW